MLPSSLNLVFVEQFLKQHAIVNHRLSQVFCAGLACAVPQCNVVRGTIVIDDDWIIDGQVCCPLFELSNRISTRLHHVGDQVVGNCHRSSRIVDEARLHFIPAHRVA